MDGHKIQPTSVHLTTSAAARVKVLRAQQGDDTLMLRVAVDGGGCSGFQYRFDFAKMKKSDDYAFETDDVIMLIDEASLPFLTGAEVDFVDELIGAAFQVNNPNATANCGCGTSFNVF